MRIEKCLPSISIVSSNRLIFNYFTTTLKRKAKTKKSNIYFTDETEQAVIDYINETDPAKRNQIYNDKLDVPLSKLAENIFNTFKFVYCGDTPLNIQRDVVHHIIQNINKFNKTKGKAYSYFSIVAKNYLIHLNNTNYKASGQMVNISDLQNEEDDDENGNTSVSLQTEDPYYKEHENEGLMDVIIDFWNKNAEKYFPKPADLNIVYAIIELFRNYKRIETFNKKTLYLFIREISDCKTQQITKIVNKMKILQNPVVQEYRHQKPTLVYPEIVLT